MYLAGCLLYEVAYPFFLCFLVLALLRRRSLISALRAVVPAGTILGLFALLQVGMRLSMKSYALNAYAPNPDPVATIRAWLIHLVGGLPLSYYLCDPDAVFRNSSGLSWPEATGFSVLAVLIAWVTVRIVIRQLRPWSASREGCQNCIPNALFCLSIAVAAPALIATSPKYQQIPWGSGYIPVYFCSLGLAGVTAAVAILVARRVREFSRIGRAVTATTVIIIWCLVYGLNARNNMFVVRAADEVFYDSRRVLERAARSGFLSDVPEGSTLFVDGSAYGAWNIPGFYAQEAGRVYRVIHMQDSQNYGVVLQQLGAVCTSASLRTECNLPEKSSVYVVRASPTGKLVGSVVLARIEEVVFEGDKLIGVFGSRADLFVWRPFSVFFRSDVGVAGTDADRGRSSARGRFWVAREELREVSSGRQWVRLRLERDGLFDALGLAVIQQSSSRGPTSTIAHTHRLKSPDEVLIHLGHLGGLERRAVILDDVLLEPNTSVELLVRANVGGHQPSTLVDSRCTAEGPESVGFVMEQADSGGNNFRARFRQGNRSATIGHFELVPKSVVHIVVQTTARRIRLFLNGTLVGERDLVEDLKPSSGDLVVGNSARGDKPFNGTVEEVLVYRGAKSDSQLKETVHSLGHEKPSEYEVGRRRR
ncbi:MAG: LamG-like jellyroll fold domain-containing protein [Bryobacteraceae bacterium]